MEARPGTPIWDDSGSPSHPVLEGEVRADVCVVGLGGSGLSCLRELQQLGVDAVGVDADGVGAGAAGRNGGVLLAGLPDFHHRAVARFGRERALALYRATQAQLARMAEETPGLVRLCGSLRIAGTDRERHDCLEQYDAMRRDGLPVEWYQGGEGDGLLFPGDGVFQPLARARELGRRVAGAGARLFERSPVHALDAGAVHSEQGLVRCRRTVVAVDGALERVLPELQGRVRTGRVQMLATAPETRVSFPRPVYTRWGYDFWWQLDDGRVVMGGKRDAGGWQEWTHRPATDPAVQGQLNYQLSHLGISAPVTHRWAGVIGFSDTGLPLMEEVRDNLLAIGGYSGTGNVMGALLGREAARWAVGAESPVRALLQT